METIRIAIVSLPYHQDVEILKHLNLDARAYEVLELKQVPMFLQYIQNDIRIRTTTRIAAETHRDDFAAFIEAIKNDSEVSREVMECFYNFYLDYIESIRHIVKEPTLTVLYPMASTKEFEFDYYIVLEQDVEKIREECESEGNALLFSLTQQRINKLVTTLPANKTARLKVDYVPRNSNEEALSQTLVEQLGSIIANFYNDYHNSVEVSNVSNPQSSNSTL